jgi:GMP synthase-like glutamine amidotransferase
MRILIIKNGICETDIGQIIYEVNRQIETDTICSRSIDYDSLDISSYDGVLILGGSQRLSDPDVLEIHPYLTELITRIRKWIDTGIHIMGICLGAQLIAIALNHKVVKCDRLISGYDQDIRLTEVGRSDPLFDFNFDVFRSYLLSLHFDRIELSNDRGEKVNVLAELQGIPYAFRYRNAYGIQFHPDITLRILETFCSEFSFDPRLIEEGSLIANCTRTASIIFFLHWILTIHRFESD